MLSFLLDLKMSGEKRFFEGDEHVKLYVTSRPSVPLKIGNYVLWPTFLVWSVAFAVLQH